MDRFSSDRARTAVEEAHLSNFLHPVMRLYTYSNARVSPVNVHRHQLTMIAASATLDAFSIVSTHSLPRPRALLHLVEDLHTSFTAPLTHVAQLRRWLEFTLALDLKSYSASECAAMLTLLKRQPSKVPLFCRYMTVMS